MPTVAERLRHIELKVERANKHIIDLEREIAAFLGSNPYQVRSKRNPDTRQLIYYLAEVKSTPDCLALIAGDCIQNLMCALDHLAYQLVSSDTNDAPPNPNRIYFPIADTEEKYEARKHGKMEGAHPDTMAAIDALKPYQGGNEPLWMLYKLNNVEKHRLLITVGSMFQSVNVGASVSAIFTKLMGSDQNSPFLGKEFPIFDTFLTPADTLFPLKAGDELFVDAVDAEENPKTQFAFSVALYEPQVIKAKSIVETIHQMTALVKGIVAALTPRLKDTA